MWHAPATFGRAPRSARCWASSACQQSKFLHCAFSHQIPRVRREHEGGQLPRAGRQHSARKPRDNRDTVSNAVDCVPHLMHSRPNMPRTVIPPAALQSLQVAYMPMHATTNIAAIAATTSRSVHLPMFVSFRAFVHPPPNPSLKRRAASSLGGVFRLNHGASPA